MPSSSRSSSFGGSGYETFPIFFPALLKYFGWSRAQLSTLGSAGAIVAGLAGPFVGWLLDRFEAQRVMIGGALVTALAYVAASRASSYLPLLLATLVIDIGVTASTVMPCSLVISNWFGARRGLALGVAFAGTSLGGMGMTLVSNRVIASDGWRSGYVVLAIPMIVIAIPVILLSVQTRPAAADGRIAIAHASDALPGFELREAMRTRSFWMISAAQFLFACSIAGLGLHMIAYLIGVGYSATSAAKVLSAIFLLTSIGKLAMGIFADRLSARVALTANFSFSMLGLTMIFGVAHTAALAGFVIFYGLTVGAPLVLMPMVMAESLGLRRLGSVMGISGMFATAGAAVGPILAGRVFDVTGSYTAAFGLFVAMWFFAAASIFACQPLDAEQSRLAAVSATA